MKTKKRKMFSEFGVLMVLVALCVALSISSPVFLNRTNIINVIRQTVEIGIMAIGMSLLIISGEMDLSVGSVFGATAMMAAWLLKHNVNSTLVLLLAIVSGALIGCVNGLLVTKTKLPSFIATLGTMQIFRSVAYSISNGQSISVFPDSAINSWVFKMGATVGNIPVQVFIFFFLIVLSYVVLRHTKLGYEIYATGGNRRAAQLAGINTDRIKIICFALTGALCALTGMISIAYLQSVTTTSGQGREMDVIAAVVLGGASLNGGRGGIVGTLIGALIMSVIKNGMVLLSVPVFWQDGFIGVVIILAVVLDTWLSKSSTKN